MNAVALAPPPKPLLRGVFHQVGFFVAVVAGVGLVLEAPGASVKLACAAYAASLSLLLGTSALYHRPTWAPRARARMRRADHSAIFVLIAGTYTPMAMTLPPAQAKAMLTVAWGGALLGVLRAIFWVNAPKWLVAVLALAMGWVALLYLPTIGGITGPGVLAWMALGGVLYSVGAVIYAVRRPNPWPKTFGYHEVFHALILVAAACHFVAVVQALPFMR
ncbi:MAG: hemolysin III family protein [Myxococcaceae bacterium]|nr:hemolysin III family protein [Myxococcaceae bacterium]MCA3011676.1 hemolysin III family protein [Myxococcaceae bacterium]